MINRKKEITTDMKKDIKCLNIEILNIVVKIFQEKMS